MTEYISCWRQCDLCKDRSPEEPLFAGKQTTYFVLVELEGIELGGGSDGNCGNGCLELNGTYIIPNRAPAGLPCNYSKLFDEDIPCDAIIPDITDIQFTIQPNNLRVQIRSGQQFPLFFLDKPLSTPPDCMCFDRVELDSPDSFWCNASNAVARVTSVYLALNGEDPACCPPDCAGYY